MIAVEFDIPDFARQLNAAGTSISHVDNDKLLKACAVLVKNDLKKNLQAGKSPDGSKFKPLKFPRPNGKSQPLWDTGALLRSLGSGPGHVEKLGGGVLEIGTNLEYAGLHQRGGTITPKHGNWLTIPITTAAKRAGGARNFQGKLSFVPLGRGKAALRETRQARGKKGKAKTITHYILVKKVEVPARPFIGFSDNVLKRIDDAVAKAATGG